MPEAQTTLRVDFVSELAGYRNTFGWYNKVTGEGGILFSDVEAEGRRPTVVAGVSSVEFSVASSQLGNIEYFLIPNGGDIDANSDRELSGPIKVVQLANGSWAVATVDRHGNVETKHGKPNILQGEGTNAFFTETSKNAGGVDYASSTVGKNQTAATLAGDRADGAVGLIAWEDLAASKKHGVYGKPGDADYNDAVFRVSIVDAPGDTAPTTTPVSLGSIAEGGGRLITQAQLLVNASDADGDSLTVLNLRIESGGGTLADNGNGTWTYTPAADDDTSASFTYEVTDGTHIVAGTASLDLTPVNDAPTASPVDLGAIDEDGSRLVTAAELLAGVNDIDGPAASITALSIQTGGGALVDNGNGTWTYAPATDDDTAVTFAYTASDGEFTASSAASLDLAAVNDAPTASPVDLGAIDEDGSRLVTAAELLAGVGDVDGPAASIAALAIQTGGGTLTDNGNGTWTYAPAIDDDTAVTFAYTASDGEFTASSTASLDLAAVNDAPTASPVDLGTIAEDGSRLITAAELLAGVNDIDGPAASITALAIQTGGGALVDNGNGTWTYAPATDDDTSVTFGYTASDGEFSASSTASLDLTSVNDAPTAAAVDLGSIAEDGTRLITEAELLAGVSDVDGPAATITALSIQTGSGTLVDNGNGTWSYTPAVDDDTTVTFAYTASDGEFSATSTASLDLTPVNDAPTAATVDLGSIAEGGSRLITAVELLAGVSDIDGPAATIASLSIETGGGALIDNLNGTWSYTPATDDDSSVTFSYTASDGEFSASSTASLDLTPVNDAPIAAPVDLGSIAEDGSRLITAAELLAGVSDIDSPAATIASLAIQTGGGTLIDNLNGTWSYTPATDDDNSVTFSYTASDGEFSASSTASLELTSVNDAPTAAAVDLGSIAEDGGRLITAAELLAGVSDVDGLAATVTSLSIQTGGGALIDNLNGTWSYTPATDDDSSVTFSYTASDGEFSASSTASLDLTPVNDAPTAATVDLGSIGEGGSRLITAAELLAGVSDIDGPAATITSLSIQSGGGTLIDNLNGTWSYTPATDDDTSVTFSYTASDGEFSASSTVSLDLIPVNDAPTITAPNGGAPTIISVPENTTAVADVDATDADTGNTLTYSILETAGTDFDKFAINAAGILTFLVAPNFELPADIGGVAGDNIYVVDVQVSDGHGGFDTQTISVAVSNVNEGPVAVDDLILTDDNTEVPVLEWILLYNDYDPEGDPIDLVNVANVTNLTAVTHSPPGNPGVGPSGWLFMHDTTFPANTGSFTYQASDGTPGNAATVTVLQTSNPVNGTAADEILIGGNGAGDVLNGGGGNDILVGHGLGLDTLNGGEGDDVYVFTYIDINLGPENLDADDVIADTGGTDTIAIASFGGTLLGDGNLAVWRSGNNLALGYSNNNTFSNFVVSNHFTSQPIEYLHFIGGGIARPQNFFLADTPYRLLSATEAATADDEFIVGADTNETLTGNGGEDVLYGNAGADTLHGGSGNDILNGGADNDTYTFDLTDGHDVLTDSGGGIDHIVINTNGIAFTELDFERVDGDGPGGDAVLNELVMRYEGQSIMLHGVSTFGPERIQFAGGASVLGYDLGGAVYTLSSGSMGGSPAQDFLVGSNNADTMGGFFPLGTDGSAGNDVLYGLGGNDTLQGGPNNDLLVGGTGDDTYVIDGASDGVDTVFDESGTADRIHFDGVVTNLPFNFARSGDDLLLTYGSGQQMTVLDHYAGTGNGVEQLRFANGTGYAGYVLTTGIASPFLIDSDLIGGATQDVIISTGDAEMLAGGAAADLLFGNGGTDIFNGGTGNDLSVGGQDDDTYQFGGADGNDTIFDAGGAADAIVFTDAGNDILTALNFDRQSSFPNNLAITLNSSTITVFNQFAGTAIELVQFASGATVYGYGLSASPYVIDSTFVGSPSADVVVHNNSSTTVGSPIGGQGGNDLLFGNNGNDTFLGGAGDDLLAGGLGADRYEFVLGDGNDTIFDSASAGDVIVFMPTNLTLTALDFERAGNSLVITYNDLTVTVFNQYGGALVEHLAFNTGNTIYGYTFQTAAFNFSTDITDPLSGASGPDVIVSSDAGETLTGGPSSFNDLLFGNGGNDALDGGEANDLLVGGDDDDVLLGGVSGDDTLVGGSGADSMDGGSGDDHFYYVAASDSTLASMDVINGFTAGGSIDEINLDAFDFSGAAIANIKETTPAGFTVSDTIDFFNDGGTDRAVVVEYFGGNARAFVDANKDSDFTTGDLVVQLNGVAVGALTIGDFLFG